MLVDARTEGELQEAVLNLGPNVVGWTPLVGDSAAGFGSCAKMVLGRTARVALAPGQGVLLTLTMRRDDAGDADAELARLWV